MSDLSDSIAHEASIEPVAEHLRKVQAEIRDIRRQQEEAMERFHALQSRLHELTSIAYQLQVEAGEEAAKLAD